MAANHTCVCPIIHVLCRNILFLVPPSFLISHDSRHVIPLHNFYLRKIYFSPSQKEVVWTFPNKPLQNFLKNILLFCNPSKTVWNKWDKSGKLSYPCQHDLSIDMRLKFYQISFQESQEGCQPSPSDLRQRTFLSIDEKIVTSEKHSTSLHFAIWPIRHFLLQIWRRA